MRKTLLGSVIMAAGLLGSSAIDVRSEPTNAAPWGRSICGASLRVTSEFKEYKLGKPMPFTVSITNAGEVAVTLAVENSVESNYRLDLFDSDGRPLETLDRRTGEPSGVNQRVILDKIQPGEEFHIEFMLDKYFALRKAGVYYLIVQRAFIAQSAKSLMSSLVIVRVVE